MASKVQTVLEALKTALEVDYSGTAYAPDLVQLILFWPDQKAFPIGVNTVYLIRPGEKVGAQVQSCDVTEQLEVFILAAHRYTSASEDPFKEDPSRLSVSTDLIADVEEKLRQDAKLGGEALDVFQGSQTADYERYLPKWVVPEYRTVIRYRYLKDAR